MKLFAGNEAYLHFYLSNFTDKQSLVDAVRNIPYCGRNTNMTGGLRLTRIEIFNAVNGDRSGVPNVIVLVTDGNPTREVESLHDEVARIKRLNIKIIGVGITDWVSAPFLPGPKNIVGCKSSFPFPLSHPLPFLISLSHPLPSFSASRGDKLCPLSLNKSSFARSNSSVETQKKFIRRGFFGFYLSIKLAA